MAKKKAKKKKTAKRKTAKKRATKKKVTKKKTVKKKTAKRKVSKKKTVKKKTTKRKKPSTTKKRSVTVAKRKTKKSGTRSKRRSVALISPRTINTLVDSAIIGGAALGSTALVNMAPVVKDWPAWQKALFQVVAGIFGLTFARNLMVKKAFSGSVVGAAISLIMPFMPAGFKFAGARPLTADEMTELATLGLGRPVGVPNNMGKPVYVPNSGMSGNNRSRMSQR